MLESQSTLSAGGADVSGRKRGGGKGELTGGQTQPGKRGGGVGSPEGGVGAKREKNEKNAHVRKTRRGRRKDFLGK